MLRKAEGVGGRTVQERLYRLGAQFGSDGVELDGGHHSPCVGEMSSGGCSGLVPRSTGNDRAIEAPPGVCAAKKRNKSGKNPLPRQDQHSTRLGRGSVRAAPRMARREARPPG